MRDFWNGAYKRFLVRGPTDITIHLSRNHSFCTILAGVWAEPQSVLVECPGYDTESVLMDFLDPKPPTIALRRLIDVSIMVKGSRAAEAASAGLAIIGPDGRLKQFGEPIEKGHREVTVQAVPQGPARLVVMSDSNEIIHLSMVDTSGKTAFEAVCEAHPVVEFLLKTPKPLDGGADQKTAPSPKPTYAPGEAGIEVVDAECRLPMRRMQHGPEMTVTRLQLPPKHYEVYAVTPRGWVLLDEVDLTRPEAGRRYEFAFDPAQDHHYLSREDVYRGPKR